MTRGKEGSGLHREWMGESEDAGDGGDRSGGEYVGGVAPTVVARIVRVTEEQKRREPFDL